MGIQNQNIVDVANTAFRAKFDEIFAMRPSGPYEKYVEIIDTDSVINEVDVLETMPVVRQWLGAKVFQSILASNFTATIVKWERSFAMDRLKLSGDKLGMIGRRINMMMSDAGQIFDNICFSSLIANPVGYDGVAVHSAAHPRGPAGANQSNLTATAFGFANHDSIMTAGATLRDNNSESVRVAYDTLIVGPSNKRLGMEVTQSKERMTTTTAAGVQDAAAGVVAAATIPNVYGGGEMELIVDPRLVGTYAAKCVYVDSKIGPKPIILYVMRDAEPIEQTAMDSDGRFLLDELRYSVECDAVPTAGAWQSSFFINA
jgi:phage major head subunit gpT-like protein